MDHVRCRRCSLFATTNFLFREIEQNLLLLLLLLVLPLLLLLLLLAYILKLRSNAPLFEIFRKKKKTKESFSLQSASQSVRQAGRSNTDDDDDGAVGSSSRQTVGGGFGQTTTPENTSTMPPRS
jgi:hypothetical protein